MEQIITYMLFLTVLGITLYKSEVSLAILLNINIFRAVPYVNYENPVYGYYNENDILLGAILPILCFCLITVKVFLKKKPKYKLDSFDYFLGLLSIMMIFSIMVSPNKSHSVYYTGIFFGLGIPFFYITKFYFSNVVDKSKSLTIFMISTVVFAIAFSIASLYLNQIAKYPYNRLTFPGVYPIPFCLFLCQALIFIIFYYVMPDFKNRLSRLTRLFYSLPLVGVVVFTILKTNTRGPVFSMILAVIIILFMFFKIKINLKTISKFLFVMVVGLIGLLSFFDLSKIASRFINILPDDKKANSVAMRLDTYIDSLMVVFYRPVGISVGTFKEYVSGFSDGGKVDGYAHNLFLELISSFGVFGIVLVGILLLFCLNEYSFLIKNQKLLLSNPYLCLALVTLLFFFIETQFSFTLNSHKGWYLSMALYSVFRREFIKNIKDV